MTQQEIDALYRQVDRQVQMAVEKYGVEVAQMFMVAAGKALALTFSEPMSAVISDIAESVAVVEGHEGLREISVH